MITSKGFEFEVKEKAIKDAELIELMARCEAGEADEEPLIFYQLLEKMLGKEQKKRLYDHCRDEEGYVPLADLVSEYKEIVNLIYASGTEDTKNS